MTGRKILITGASSGIGYSTAVRLAEQGHTVYALARREDLLAELARKHRVETIVADTTRDDDVGRVVSHLTERGGIDTLVNNAGIALGTESVEEASIDDWREMFEVNVLGTKRMITACLPLLRDAARERGSADILTVTSTAAFTPYEGGGGYNASKYAARAMVDVLRLELAGEPIRIIDIAPGMVMTDEFTLKRNRGDTDKTRALYDSVDHPLVADDVARVIVDSLALPWHVNLDRVVMRPVAQAAQHKLHRGPLEPRDRPEQKP
jgi:NADP-dependent 3-hydroxy acid dehydrogenase YdfG